MRILRFVFLWLAFVVTLFVLFPVAAQAQQVFKHDHPVQSVMLSSDAKYCLVSGGKQSDIGEVKIWDTAKGTVKGELKGHKSTVKSAAFSTDGKSIVTADFDLPPRIKKWDFATLAEKWDFKYPLSGAFMCEYVRFTPDDKSVCCLAIDAEFKKPVQIGFFASDTGKEEEKSIVGGRLPGLTSFAFSPDGKQLVFGSSFNIHVWDREKNVQIIQKKWGIDQIGAAAYAPTGPKRLAVSTSGGGNSVIHVFDLTTEKETAKEDAGDYIRCVAFSPDGKWLAVGGGIESPGDEKAGKGTLKLWNVKTMKVEATLSGHTGAITAVSFSADGKLLASGSLDKTARLWNVAKELKAK